MIGLTVRQMTDNNYLGDLQRFGDVITTPIENAISYYHLNSYQKQQVFFLHSSHLEIFADYWGVEPADYRLVFVLSRLGFSKIAQLLCVASSIVYPDKDETHMRIIETRFIAIGRKGGLKLLNPARRGTVPHGKQVLLAEPENSLWGRRIKWDVSGAFAGSRT